MKTEHWYGNSKRLLFVGVACVGLAWLLPDIQFRWWHFFLYLLVGGVHGVIWGYIFYRYDHWKDQRKQTHDIAILNEDSPQWRSYE